MKLKDKKSSSQTIAPHYRVDITKRFLFAPFPRDRLPSWIVWSQYLLIAFLGGLFSFLVYDASGYLSFSYPSIFFAERVEGQFGFFPSLSSPFPAARDVFAGYVSLVNATGETMHDEIMQGYGRINSGLLAMQDELLLDGVSDKENRRASFSTSQTIRGMAHIAACVSSLNESSRFLAPVIPLLDDILSKQTRVLNTVYRGRDVLGQALGADCLEQAYATIGSGIVATKSYQSVYQQYSTQIVDQFAEISVDPLQCFAKQTVQIPSADGAMNVLNGLDITRSAIDLMIKKDPVAAMALLCDTPPIEQDAPGGEQQSGESEESSDGGSESSSGSEQSSSGESAGEGEGSSGGPEGLRGYFGEQGAESGQGQDGQGGQEQSQNGQSQQGNDQGQGDQQAGQSPGKGSSELEDFTRQLGDMLQDTGGEGGMSDQGQGGEGNGSESRSFPEERVPYLEEINQQQDDRSRDVEQKYRDPSYSPYREILNTFDQFYGDLEEFLNVDRERKKKEGDE